MYVAVFGRSSSVFWVWSRSLSPTLSVCLFCVFSLGELDGDGDRLVFSVLFSLPSAGFCLSVACNWVDYAYLSLSLFSMLTRLLS